VQQGDTLASIAQGWFGDSNRWTFIAESNPGLNPNQLSVGQVIMLPQKDTSGVAAPTSPISGRTYQVRSGDSLATISRSCYGSDGHWTVLYEANKAAIGSDPETLKVGTVLSIPALP
jgi:nucleoid-associated protein YgaU